MLFSIKVFSTSYFYYTFEVENQSFSDDNPFNEEDDVLVSFVLNGQKGDKGDKGMTGGPGPRRITGKYIDFVLAVESYLMNRITRI